jgi:hypothetical protein
MIQEGFTWGGEVECDNAKRWRYVQAATKFCNSQQANQIAALCKLWNQLRYMPGDRTKFDEFHNLSAEQKAVLESIHGHSDICAIGRDVGNASSEQGYFVRYPNFCCGSQASVTTSAGGWRLKWMVKSSISEALWEVCDCEE